jgi:hypothetical protein
MTDTPPLDDFTTPIVSGLTEAPEGVGRLSSARAAELDTQLRDLASARAEAEVGARTYVVCGRTWLPSVIPPMPALVGAA